MDLKNVIDITNFKIYFITKDYENNQQKKLF